MTILAFAGIVGSWIIGAMDQKLGTKKTMIFFGIWYAVALLLEVTEKRPLVIVFLIMFALALGGSANFTTSLPAAVFGRHGFKKVKLCTFPDSGTGIFLRLLCKWKCIKRNRKPANVLCHCSHCFYRCRYHCTFHQ